MSKSYRIRITLNGVEFTTQSMTHDEVTKFKQARCAYTHIVVEEWGWENESKKRLVWKPATI